MSIEFSEKVPKEGKVVYFIKGLVDLAKKGNKKANNKLDDCESFWRRK